MHLSDAGGTAVFQERRTERSQARDWAILGTAEAAAFSPARSVTEAAYMAGDGQGHTCRNVQAEKLAGNWEIRLILFGGEKL